jgi:hypothetical protein
MSLRIFCEENPAVVVSESGPVTLPTVRLEPTGPVTVTAITTVGEVLSASLSPALKADLEQGLANVYYGPVSTTTEWTLSQPATLQQRVLTVLPMREPVRTRVTLTVHYRVGKQAPSKARAEFTMQMTPMPPLPSSNSHALQPPRLELQQPVVNLTITSETTPGEEVKPQLVELLTHHLPEGQQPAIKFRVHPQGTGPLTKELQRLAMPFELAKTDGEVKYWKAHLSQQFSTAAVIELRKQTADVPLRLLCQVATKDAAVDLVLYLRVKGADFPGLVAIDLGTTNTTVTVYDPGVQLSYPGLWPEQEECIRSQFRKLVCDETGSRLPDLPPELWQRVLAAWGKYSGVPQGAAQQQLLSAVDRGGLELLEALRRLEQAVVGSDAGPAVRAALQRIYESAFHAPRLASISLMCVKLDQEAQEEVDLPSEVQLTENGDPLGLAMGKAAQNARRKASRDPRRSTTDVHFEFHPSPKRYVGSSDVFAGQLSGQPVTVTASAIVKATYWKLIDMINSWRKRERTMSISQGSITRVVATYPTVSNPAARSKLREILRDLGFPVVVTDYDEAVAAAFFYFHREVGGSLDLGPDLFKSRARKEGDAWHQTVMVLDVGGGSTDVALMTLKLEEINPFNGDSDRGAGGRYYVLTPRLLGSSGNTHLGGNLITLRVFEMLKATLADRLLQAAEARQFASVPLDALLKDLEPQFTTGVGRYRPGSLCEAVVQRQEDDDVRRRALERVERILPTRWEQDRSRFPFFSELWTHAERAKINHLGKDEDFHLSAEEVRGLLTTSGLHGVNPGELQLDVTLQVKDFHQAADRIIEEAVTIAHRLLRDRLASKDDKGTTETPSRQLDRLILSGKTWNMPRAYDVLRRAMSNSDVFAYNEDRIIFDPQYAKLATSAGACYAEHMRMMAMSPESAKDILRQGLNYLLPKVDNLFWFLPCSFVVLTGGNMGFLKIFEVGRRLYRLDTEPVGKTRSEKIGAMRLVNVLRQDYAGAKPIIWCSFGGQELADRVGMGHEEFTRKVWLQFEVDHQLLMRLYAWKSDDGSEPHHFSIEDGPKVVVPPKEQVDEEKPAAPFDLCVNFQLTQNHGREPHRLIKAGQPFDAWLHLENDEKVRGLIVDLPDTFPGEEISLHYSLPGQRNPDGSQVWTLAGKLPRPLAGGDTHFPSWYQLSLDEKGCLRVHLGKVPYWSTTDEQVWAKEEGRVLVREMDRGEAPTPPGRDPLDGTH